MTSNTSHWVHGHLVSAHNSCRPIIAGPVPFRSVVLLIIIFTLKPIWKRLIFRWARVKVAKQKANVSILSSAFVTKFCLYCCSPRVANQVFKRHWWFPTALLTSRHWSHRVFVLVRRTNRTWWCSRFGILNGYPSRVLVDATSAT